MSPPVAVPAATLVILRDRPGTAPEVLMVERSRRMAFAPGALVFPGGRVDPADRAIAGMDDDGAARVAALRETIEETGLLLAADAPAEAGAAIRAALAGGTGFADALAAAGATLLPDRLVPFARWRPTHRVVRAFDARFYLARAPDDAPAPLADGTECARAFWIGAADALAEVERGSASMIFPTRRTVERIARYASVEEAFIDAAAHPVRVIEPWIEHRDGADWLCIPGDLGFPVTAERLADAQRG